jgi:hypothetical protein
MEKTRFNLPIWTVPPFSSNIMSNWYNGERAVKELILKNPITNELGVSEMNLNIKKFAAIDKAGNEHHILDIQGQNSVAIKGIGSGHFYYLKSSRVDSLKPGTYETLRLYVGKRNNKFIYSDGVAGKANDFDYLDFRMEKPLIIGKDGEDVIKLWFDLTPYQFSRHFRPLLDWLKRKKEQLPRLASNLG